MPSPTDPESLARVLEAHPDYRVLRRMPDPLVFPAHGLLESAPLKKGVIVDVETTGLDHDVDKIIEIGIVVFEYDPETGDVFRIVETYDGLEDPGRPISEEIAALTHITNDMVRDKRIDDDTVNRLIADASVVIAHNARFDRPFLEARFPAFETPAWGCSLVQIDWDFEGIGARKLDYLAYSFGFFFDGHRAEIDCMALLNVLQQPLPVSKVCGLKVLLDEMAKTDWTVFALNSPFETKDVLKARGYRWDAARKTWHNTLAGTEAITSEAAWLKETIYKGRNVRLEFEVRDAELRYSKRSGKKVVKEI